MKRRECVNCAAWLEWGAVCQDCLRMVLVTVVAEAILGGLVWLTR
jgi:hypothetical protein